MTFSSLLDSFTTLDICVVGDVMLDEYIFGKATRISVEAPVMVVRQETRRCVPGGAANVAMNLAALGASTSVVGVASQDEAGRDLATALSTLPVRDGLVYCNDRATTRKTRVVANHSHQVIRLDHEVDSPIDDELGGLVEEKVATNVSRSNGVLVSDYRKGVLTPRVIKSVMAAAAKAGAPVFVNAKPESAELYEGAELVSLNRPEASACLGRNVASGEDALTGAE
ncbi:MAG: PfkB family carbohydrate kinase, partial [Armatimonadota bacterium]